MSTESSPSILTANGLSLSYNEQVVLSGASLTICEGQRLGLVGQNGAGKSTFLKILAGEMPADSGEITRRRDLRIGYLPQQMSLTASSTVWDAIRDGAHHILDYIAEFEALPPHSTRHEELERAIQNSDGWNLDTRIRTAMSHLNVPAAERVIGQLSGGEQRRVALCRALIARPDLLLLDEPTNHLDTESIDWLGDCLLEYPGTFLVITHDRHFLERITSSIVELANGVFYFYEGRYMDYLVAKAEREATEEILEHKRQGFLRKELQWVRRGPPARTTKSKSRLDRYFAKADMAPPEVESEVEMIIPPPPPLGSRIVDLTHAGVEFAGRFLFQGLTFNFEKGMKIGVIGKNGIGKTTLLKVIMGQLPLTEGTIKTGMLTQFNYVDQGRVQLDPEQTLLQAASDGTEFVQFGNSKLSVRGYLKRLLFDDDHLNTPIKNLSGGEKSRLVLAKILKQEGNFLILDEPTNDLDLTTLRILEEALIQFPGCVMVVSHDRYFLNRVCTGVLVFEEEGRVFYSPGDYDYYLEKRAQRLASRAALESKWADNNPKSAKSDGKSKPRKLTWNETRELEGMETRIQSVEEEIGEIEALYCLPDFHQKYALKVRELEEKLQTARETRDRHYARWQELEAIVQAFEKRS